MSDQSVTYTGILHMGVLGVKIMTFSITYFLINLFSIIPIMLLPLKYSRILLSHTLDGDGKFVQVNKDLSY